MFTKKRDAFTLIELVVVIVILGILAAVAVPKYVDIKSKAEETACRGQRDTVRAACSMYKTSQVLDGAAGAYPSTYNSTGLYDGDVIPSCPGTGTFNYDSTTGRVTCTQHGS